LAGFTALILSQEVKDAVDEAIWFLDRQWFDILLLPLAVAKEAVGVLEKLFDSGYAYSDTRTENILVDKQKGLKFIDFEYLHGHRHKPKSFEGYDLVGALKDFEEDKPLSGARTYATMVRYYVGLDLSSLRRDPPWKQYLKRTVYCWGYFLPKQLPRKLKSSLLRLLNSRANSAE
jgi:hypothetical protein